MERDERVVVFGEDVGVTGGVFRATDGLFARYGQARVIDTPLAEGVIAGAAIGLAIAGWVPVAEIQFLGFAHNGFNQVVDQLARVRYRSAGRFSAQVTLRAPYGGGVRAPELHSDAFEAHFTHAPGLKVIAPSTPADAKGLLLASIRDPDPVLFLEPLRGYRQVKGEVPAGDYTVELGEASVAREGSDVTVIAWSAAGSTPGRGGCTGAGHLGRGPRPPVAGPARREGDRGFGEQDRPRGRRPGGSADFGFRG